MGGVHASRKVDERGVGNENSELSLLDWTMAESVIRGSLLSFLLIQINLIVTFQVCVLGTRGLSATPCTPGAKSTFSLSGLNYREFIAGCPSDPESYIHALRDSGLVTSTGAQEYCSYTLQFVFQTDAWHGPLEATWLGGILIREWVRHAR